MDGCGGGGTSNKDKYKKEGQFFHYFNNVNFFVTS